MKQNPEERIDAIRNVQVTLKTLSGPQTTDLELKLMDMVKHLVGIIESDTQEIIELRAERDKLKGDVEYYQGVIDIISS